MDIEENFVRKYSFEQKKYSEIEDELGIDRQEVQKLYAKTRSETESIQKIRTKFTGKRKEDFKNNFEDFYNWYNEAKQECGYCGVTQDELSQIFREEKFLPLNEAVKRSSGTLEIERRDSAENSYGKENIILACPLCNNAKSNLIDEESWRDFFVEPMQKYYKKILTQIKNLKDKE